ncbi:MAG: hypothetical protein A2X64_06740 [Ignavibacteria bacterium GWF2_33_9]|nr:MAG: hypothetical protein A2X64_06740 [Ignavibacteria bacterium GWF2_33_9]
MKVYLQDYAWDDNCGCPDQVEEAILAHIFNSDEVKNSLGIDHEGDYEGIEFYNVNCVKLTSSTAGPFSHHVVACEGSSCCLHEYTVNYEYSCPDGLCGYRVHSITTTSVSTPDDNCEILEYPNVPIATCFPNCANWTVNVVIPPGMQKISVNEEEIVIKENSNSLLEKLSIEGIDEFSVIDLNGNILYKSNEISKGKIEKFINHLKSGAYFYIYKKDNIFYKGKLLIVR